MLDTGRDYFQSSLEEATRLYVHLFEDSNLIKNVRNKRGSLCALIGKTDILEEYAKPYIPPWLDPAYEPRFTRNYVHICGHRVHVS